MYEVKNNKVIVAGTIISPFTYSHEIFGEGFYMADLKAERLSGNADIVPIMVSERILDTSLDYTGTFVCVNGQFRSYNRHKEQGNKLILSVFVREIDFSDEMGGEFNTNQIYLDGYICKEPIYRRTPQGREIADLLLAVNRPYGKSDYIPCICWDRNARYASGFEVGSRCAVRGRIQSREYMKKLSEDQLEKRIAFEVSVSKLEVSTDEE